MVTEETGRVGQPTLASPFSSLVSVESFCFTFSLVSGDLTLTMARFDASVCLLLSLGDDLPLGTRRNNL